MRLLDYIIVYSKLARKPLGVIHGMNRLFALTTCML